MVSPGNRWVVSQWKATPSCTFSVGGVADERKTYPVLNALLSLNDTTAFQAELDLLIEGSFTIQRNQATEIFGTWEVTVELPYSEALSNRS
jgi:hypothetical protein